MCPSSLTLFSLADDSKNAAFQESASDFPVLYVTTLKWKYQSHKGQINFNCQIIISAFFSLNNPECMYTVYHHKAQGYFIGSITSGCSGNEPALLPEKTEREAEFKPKGYYHW